MIKKFKVGKWYRYVGRKVGNWASKMDAILDGKPRKVLDANGEHIRLSSVDGGYWFYGHTLEDWERVPKKQKQIDLTKPQIVKKDVLIEVSHNNVSWEKGYLLAISTPEYDNRYHCYSGGMTGKEHGFVPNTWPWKYARHIQPKPKKVTLELTEEQAEKVKKDLGLGANNG